MDRFLIDQRVAIDRHAEMVALAAQLRQVQPRPYRVRLAVAAVGESLVRVGMWLLRVAAGGHPVR